MTENEKGYIECAADSYRRAANELETAARDLAAAAYWAELASGPDWDPATTHRRPTLPSHAKAAQEAAKQASQMALVSIQLRAQTDDGVLGRLA